MPGFAPKPLTGRLGMLAQLASLLLTGVLIWNSAVRPQLLFLPFFDIATRALVFAILAWFLSAAITLGLYLTVPGLRSAPVLPSAFRAASVGVWFAPACILLSQLSPASLAAALVLVVAATRLLYGEWVASGPPPPAPAPTPALGLFGRFNVKRPFVTRELLTGLAAALALQAGVISVWKHHPLMAGACFVLSAAIVTLFAMVSGAVDEAPPPSLPRSAVGMAMTVLLAAGLTVGGIRATRGSGTADGDGMGPGAAGARNAFASAREVLRELFGDEEKGTADADPLGRKTPRVVPGISPDGSFPGIILWPELKPITRLVAPPPKGVGTGEALQRSFAIPFAGQYLLYRFPQLRPPPTSILQRGSPAAMSFSTIDRVRLNMDAIQKLDEPIDLSCCSAVRVEIWNADKYPDTVVLELYANATLLGSAPVRSSPDLNLQELVAVRETLEFPSAPLVCTELKIVFRRHPTRADKSARIAIDRFVLVP
jgi:hypothetical protein